MSDVTFRPARISIGLVLGGTEVVPASVAGSWGVHKVKSGWNVTHVPSGRAVKFGLRTKTEGEDLVRAFVAADPALLNASLDQVMSKISLLGKVVKNPYSFIQKEPPKTRATPTKWELKHKFETAFKEAGLTNLGDRSMKHGDHWGLPGGSMRIRIGARDLVWTEFVVRNGRDVWVTVDMEYQSRVTDSQLAKWIREVKRAPSMKEVRDQSR
jgi:hypothetical protein